MLVSAVVPVFNHERYVRECLLSLLNQTWEDLELVVIDDVSSDGSFERVEAFANQPVAKDRFSRILVERNEINLGAAATINKAIEKTTGQMIMIVNSDDLYAPSRVARCIAELERGSEMVFTGIKAIDCNGKQVFAPEAWALQSENRNVTSFPTISTSLIGMNRAISTGNFCFTRELFNSAGPFRNLRYCHDWDFILSATLISEPVFVSEELYLYRLHDTNSFRSLAHVAEEESRMCLERYFGNIRRAWPLANPRLRTIVEDEYMWQRIIARSGPVIVEEWNRAARGHTPRLRG